MASYTVVKGDTMWNIATKNGIKLNELLTANPHIVNPNLIYPGQTINIPKDTDASDDIRKMEMEVIRLVNVEREKLGRPALVENSKMSSIARTKSNDFVKNNYFSHTSPTYGSPFDMLKSFGITYSAAAENLASGQGTPTQVMNTWMSSSGHRANILNSTYNQIGVGIARDSKGKLYWTQMFIKG